MKKSKENLCLSRKRDKNIVDRSVVEEVENVENVEDMDNVDKESKAIASPKASPKLGNKRIPLLENCGSQMALRQVNYIVREGKLRN